MSVTISITQTDVETAMRAFLLDILPEGVEIVAGQDNAVSAPVSSDYCVITPLFLNRLRTNIDKYAYDPTNPDPATLGTASAEQGVEGIFQVDVFGPNSQDNAIIISTLWRDPYAAEFFADIPSTMRPLYCDDPKQTPFTDEGSQYVNRWTIDARLQYNPVVTRDQQFAIRVGPVKLVNVDTIPVGD